MMFAESERMKVKKDKDKYGKQKQRDDSALVRLSHLLDDSTHTAGSGCG
jgi:hypothetical protein